MGNRLYIVGIGPGERDFITPAAKKLVEGSDVIIGGRRNLELFDGMDRDKLVIGGNLDEIYEYIRENIGKKSIAVLVTGDPGLYSMMEFLKRKLENVDMEVLPGISSFQYLCSRMKLSWDDVFITSVHGREQADLLDIIRKNGKVAIFAGGGHKPDSVCRQLAAAGLKDLVVTVGENLSYPDERIVEGSPEDIGKMGFGNLAIMMVRHKDEGGLPERAWEYVTHGIPDDLFIRGDVPMTKEEVRSVSLSKLRLKEDSTVVDIGAGTGSVSIECGLRCRCGKVYAVEKNSAAVELVKKNRDKFGTGNVEVIEGEAPDALEALPLPDRVFVGGSGGDMFRILEWVRKIPKEVRTVINAVTVESTCEALDALKTLGFEDVEVVNISVSRGRAVGGKHLMQAINPVYVISANKPEGVEKG
ncbi:MAG: precorrin-6y C5,15-methyltransferase (decarboxylating) subunit CbiE [Clostridiales bacterium]|jgi:precorrin-6Y C5,15-methyltransferase (decarboxylating)|nr:precorrin-6y C5,15-methyltransferase (decarboxylating) subunit CbiE [Eubacteriales bacterium]MDH7565726.1 precorrin-6y C5,15-methyltransferase (decarboxylating) subunit CbiE [Clostridiales bacterium]